MLRIHTEYDGSFWMNIEHTTCVCMCFWYRSTGNEFCVVPDDIINWMIQVYLCESMSFSSSIVPQTLNQMKINKLKCWHSDEQCRKSVVAFFFFFFLLWYCLWIANFLQAFCTFSRVQKLWTEIVSSAQNKYFN